MCAAETYTILIVFGYPFAFIKFFCYQNRIFFSLKTLLKILPEEDLDFSAWKITGKFLVNVVKI